MLTGNIVLELDASWQLVQSDAVYWRSTCLQTPGFTGREPLSVLISCRANHKIQKYEVFLHNDVEQQPNVYLLVYKHTLPAFYNYAACTIGVPRYDQGLAQPLHSLVLPCGHVSCWHDNSWWAQVSHVADPVTCQAWHGPWKSETADRMGLLVESRTCSLPTPLRRQINLLPLTTPQDFQAIGLLAPAEMIEYSFMKTKLKCVWVTLVWLKSIV